MIVVYGVVGRIMTWTLQTAAVFVFLRRIRFFREMLECDFCTGFWVFTFLSFVFRLRFLKPLPYVAIIYDAIQGLLASYVNHFVNQGQNDAVQAKR